MRTTDKKYRDELMVALRMHDVPGKRVGEVLAEVETHVAETGEDPVKAFGDPREYAARIVNELGMNSGHSATAPIRPAPLAIFVLTLVGLRLGLTALDSDHTAVFTLADVVGILIILLLMPIALVAVFRAFTTTRGSVSRLGYGLGGAAGAVAVVAATAVPKHFVDASTPLLAVPRLMALVLASAFLATSIGLLAHGVRRGWVVDPR